MKFIEVICPICESDEYKVLFPDTLGKLPPVFGYKWTPEIRKSYRIVECLECGHGYCSPRLENMGDYYTDNVDLDYLKNDELRMGIYPTDWSSCFVVFC